MNAVQLSIFASKVAAVADEMAVVLRRSAFSPNIRDRLDYSCAIFNANAELCAQAAHIPVHLGSMAYAMRSVVDLVDWCEGDTLIFNDPYLGGTHLPDVTLVSPVFCDERLAGFVANRAHHANIGGDQPGSMPISSSLEEEGVVIAPQLLANSDGLFQPNWDVLCQKLGSSNETAGDLLAQLSANRKGVERVHSLVTGMGLFRFETALSELNQYAETLARDLYRDIPDGRYVATDYMDDDGQGNREIPLHVSVSITGDDVFVDFSGTSPQVSGNINCPLSVAAAATYYVFRCLLPSYAPSCAGIFRPIQIHAAEGCLINARRPAAVAAGNVETSSRIVDVVIAALAQAIPEKMPAAAQGTMNNLAMGSPGSPKSPAWSYYETIGGGMGAHDYGEGLSAVQSHMTNTFNTPIEVLETAFPVRIREYAIRDGSGGSGRHVGGNGMIREYEFLLDAEASLLTERRDIAPPGLADGSKGMTGRNALNGELLPAKCQLSLKSGDRLRIETPGGGGYGLAHNRKTD